MGKMETNADASSSFLHENFRGCIFPSLMRNWRQLPVLQKSAKRLLLVLRLKGEKFIAQKHFIEAMSCGPFLQLPTPISLQLLFDIGQHNLEVRGNVARYLNFFGAIDRFLIRSSYFGTCSLILKN